MTIIPIPAWHLLKRMRLRREAKALDSKIDQFEEVLDYRVDAFSDAEWAIYKLFRGRREQIRALLA